ncbi:MAG: thymidine phosphorylase [Planctomycetota bacterium]
MTPAHLIVRKRDGGELSADEIAFLMRRFVDGTVPEYQMSALAMAIFFQGMTDAETAALTDEMLQSGVQVQWAAGPGIVDKHSTGGVGDKVSLILAPLLAACGLRVPMISGRGLGPTGGTLDKLESIPGFRTDLSIDEMQAVVDRIGCVITGASEQLAPADRKLYALRDVTGTVPSIPLITASIMSKKLAESLDALVLDVKCGSGAFMKTPEQARALAELLVQTGRRMGVATRAVITDMNQPLGRMCGNAVEVNESLDCLSGAGPDDLRELTLALGAELLVAAEHSATLKAARETLIDRLDSGAAREKFEQMVEAQGGDLTVIRPVADEFLVRTDRAGVVESIDTEAIGRAVIDLGGGRRRTGESIDHSAGIEWLVRCGEEIRPGDLLARVFASGSKPDVAADLISAVRFAGQRVSGPPLIHGRIPSSIE